MTLSDILQVSNKLFITGTYVWYPKDTEWKQLVKRLDRAQLHIYLRMYISIADQWKAELQIYPHNMDSNCARVSMGMLILNAFS